MGKEGPKFKELRVWQKGKDLAIYIYQITNTGDFAKDYGLKDIQKETFQEIEKGCIDISSLKMLSNSKSIAARAETFCLLYTSRTKMKQDIYCAIAKLVTAASELTFQDDKRTGTVQREL